MFKITGSKGFHITFPNGVILSTQFGGGNYCDNYDKEIGEERKKSEYASTNCEIAIWQIADRNNWITEKMEWEVFGKVLGDNVKGYVNMEDWLKIFDWCKNYKKGGKDGKE